MTSCPLPNAHPPVPEVGGTASALGFQGFCSVIWVLKGKKIRCVYSAGHLNPECCNMLFNSFISLNILLCILNIQGI